MAELGEEEESTVGGINLSMLLGKKPKALGDSNGVGTRPPPETLTLVYSDTLIGSNGVGTLAPSHTILTYAHVCSRMLTYAHVCSRMLTHAHVW